MNVCVQFQASKNAFTLHGFCRLYGSQCESRRTEIDYFISIDLLVFNLKKTKEEKKYTTKCCIKTMLNLFMSSFLDSMQMKFKK